MWVLFSFSQHHCFFVFFFFCVFFFIERHISCHLTAVLNICIITRVSYPHIIETSYIPCFKMEQPVALKTKPQGSGKPSTTDSSGRICIMLFSSTFVN